MGRISRQLRRRLGDHRELDLGAQRFYSRRSRLIAQQAVNSVLEIALLPAPDGWFRRARASYDLVGTVSIARRQDDLSAPDDLAWRIAIGDQSLKPSTARRTDIKADIIPSHATSMTDLLATGNLLLGGEH